MRIIKSKQTKYCKECGRTVRHWNKTGFCIACNRKYLIKLNKGKKQVGKE